MPRPVAWRRAAVPNSSPRPDVDLNPVGPDSRGRFRGGVETRPSPAFIKPVGGSSNTIRVRKVRGRSNGPRPGVVRRRRSRCAPRPSRRLAPRPRPPRERTTTAGGQFSRRVGQHGRGGRGGLAAGDARPERRAGWRHRWRRRRAGEAGRPRRAPVERLKTGHDSLLVSPAPGRGLGSAGAHGRGPRRDAGRPRIPPPTFPRFPFGGDAALWRAAMGKYSRWPRPAPGRGRRGPVPAVPGPAE